MRRANLRDSTADQSLRNKLFLKNAATGSVRAVTWYTCREPNSGPRIGNDRGETTATRATPASSKGVHQTWMEVFQRNLRRGTRRCSITVLPDTGIGGASSSALSNAPSTAAGASSSSGRVDGFQPQISLTARLSRCPSSVPRPSPSLPYKPRFFSSGSCHRGTPVRPHMQRGVPTALRLLVYSHTGFAPCPTSPRSAPPSWNAAKFGSRSGL